MKLLALTTSIMLSLCCFSQSTVERDTLSNDLGELSISYQISGDLTSFESISIQEYEIVNGDTLSIFSGSYDLEEDDPSSFQRFEFDEANSKLTFGIGAFEPGTFHSVITINKLAGLPEEFIIN